MSDVENQSDPILTFRNVGRTYNKGKPGELVVLDGANLEVHRGEIIALVGPSGSGKSTFLHLAGLLEKPDSGEIHVNGKNTGTMSDKERTLLRRRLLGFVYQFHHLLPEFSAQENVTIPQMIAGRGKAEAMARGQVLLDHLGIGGRLKHRPAQLSGGEQQRVAIARALANDPGILLADEPTGNLDPRTAAAVFDSFISLVRNERLAAIVATHNFALAQKMDRVVLLRDGKLVDGREALNSQLETG